MVDPALAGRRLRVDDLAWRAVDGRVVVLDLRTSEYLQVNESGSMLFERMSEGASRADLLAALQEAYDLDAHQAGRDVDAFLAMLDQRGLLEPPEQT